MYSEPTTTLLMLPGLPQTATTPYYSVTVLMIERMTKKADALIDAKCARRYTVPFAPTHTSAPPIIKHLSEQITSHYVYQSYYSKDSVLASSKKDVYDEAITTLDEIRAGDVDVANSAGSLIAEAGADNKIASNVEEYIPTFGEDDALNQAVDSDKISDLTDDRG